MANFGSKLANIASSWLAVITLALGQLVGHSGPGEFETTQWTANVIHPDLSPLCQYWPNVMIMFGANDHRVGNVKGQKGKFL